MLMMLLSQVTMTLSFNPPLTRLLDKFVLKGQLQYFLGIEVKPFNKKFFISQAKYTKDIMTKQTCKIILL